MVEIISQAELIYESEVTSGEIPFTEDESERWAAILRIATWILELNRFSKEY